jgi:L-serine dehydratase
MLTYNSVYELVEKAINEGKTISQLVLEDQALQMERSETDIFNEMKASYYAMEESISNGLKNKSRTASGLAGGDALKLRQAMQEGRTIGGNTLTSILVKALAVSEYNACMGKIVAAPTAGSCGIIPSVISTVREEKNISETKTVMSLITAGAIGMVIAKCAYISGAQGGCQAECGSASAMAAAALVELLGGSPEMVANASAIALKSMLGLVCDPVAGLVEIPCIKRNSTGAANSLVAAEMALAGIESAIPVDDVIEAMKSIGDLLPSCLKETAKGGLADTATGRSLAERIYGKNVVE